jgi:uncharacterized protein (UPF0297 family)
MKLEVKKDKGETVKENMNEVYTSIKENNIRDSHNTLNRWKNYICQLLNVDEFNDVRQIGMHTADPLVPDLIVSTLKLLL